MYDESLKATSFYIQHRGLKPRSSLHRPVQIPGYSIVYLVGTLLYYVRIRPLSESWTQLQLTYTSQCVPVIYHGRKLIRSLKSFDKFCSVFDLWHSYCRLCIERCMHEQIIVKTFDSAIEFFTLMMLLNSTASDEFA